MSPQTDDEVPLIYRLESQSRSLAPQLSDSDITRFMIGTQTLKFANNQVHVVELNDETGALYTKIYNHDVGEIWFLNWSPKDPRLFISCYNTLVDGERCEMRSSLWKLPVDNLDDSQQLENVLLFPGNVKMALFHPSESFSIATVDDNSFSIWDVAKGSPELIISGALSGKGHQKMGGGKWNPNEGSKQFASLQEFDVKGWDLRTGPKITWAIENGQLIRDMDYNRNRPYYIATCGDDCSVSYWDVRQSSSPVLVQTHHSHWVWCVRFNPVHDQLVLSASSDGRAALSSASSVASEMPLDDDVPGLPSDGLLRSYDHHEDSVYCVEWSAADPWSFASLSYDGRLLVHRVAKVHKYKILGI